MADVLIVGPGAMGCLHAALLRRSGADVMLLDYRPERAQRLGREGIVLRTDAAEEHVAVPVSANPADATPARFIVLMVKAYHTAAAVSHAMPAASSETLWVTLQNGLGNVEQILDVIPAASVLAGVTTSGANLQATGVVNVAAVGNCVAGPAANATISQAENFAAAWRSAGLPCQTTPDPWPAIWRKLVVNAAVNPVAALAGRRNGDIMTFPYLRRLAFSVAQEAAAVAKACGVELGDEFDPLHAVREVCELTATNRCSMLQDLEVGRQTEIEQINGEIARRASVDVPAPLCEALTVLIKAAQGWKEAE